MDFRIFECDIGVGAWEGLTGWLGTVVFVIFIFVGCGQFGLI